MDAGRSGLLVDPRDAAAFAEAALEVLDDPDTALAFSRGAIDTSSRFSWRSTAHRLIDLYSDTQTTPSAGMRKAMAEAEVGEANWYEKRPYEIPA